MFDLCIDVDGIYAVHSNISKLPKPQSHIGPNHDNAIVNAMGYTSNPERFPQNGRTCHQSPSVLTPTTIPQPAYSTLATT